MASRLRLGIMGLSPGNGHPYSWSAIFNGYDRVAMENCGFPVIPRYLKRQSFPEDCIQDAEVTHIWTQDLNLSHQIASTTRIRHVVSNYRDMIGQVDGILLARDDAECHVEMATPFLEVGLPIYVDKPLALSLADAKVLLGLQNYPGQLFSCSALRYAPELRLTSGQWDSIGQVCIIHAFVPKDWNRYAVHVIEPLLNILPIERKIMNKNVWIANRTTTLALEYMCGVKVQIHACGEASAPIGLRVIGKLGWTDLLFTDTFRAFRSALNDFVLGIQQKDTRIPPEHMLEVVSLIEMGRNQ